jgi:hypothetical protein
MEENWINEWQYIYDEEEEEEKVMSWRTNKSEINGPQMIDIRLVKGGRRLMNSKEKRTACFLVILTFDRIIKTMNDIRTFKYVEMNKYTYIMKCVYEH